MNLRVRLFRCTESVDCFFCPMHSVYLLLDSFHLKKKDAPFGAPHVCKKYTYNYFAMTIFSVRTPASLATRTRYIPLFAKLKSIVSSIELPTSVL